MNNAHSTARLALREATRAEHDRVDAAFSSFDLANREHYTAFLLAQAEAFLPVERAIDEADAQALIDDWPERRRSGALRADLAALGADAPPVADGPPLRSAAAMLGALYVLEGSRLGGRLLERSLPEGFPRTFLGSADSALWRRLIDALDKILKTGAEIDEAVASARMVFARFENGARRHAKDAKLV